MRTKSSTVSKVAAEWAETLGTLKTVLERLELVSSLRDVRTGVYVHQGMSLVVGDQAHCVLRQSHIELFAGWQAMTLREQMKDLRAFISGPSPQLPSGFYREFGRGSKTNLILESWTQLESYRTFLPQSASPLDRDLFLTNLISLIALLQNQRRARRNRRVARPSAPKS